MKQSKNNFQSQNLTVDYLTFNLWNGKSQIQEVTNIFHSLYSFDCYLVDDNTKYTKKQKILVQNQTYQLVFAINSSEHKVNTVLIQFAKLNANHLYKILKNGQFSWQNFENFDLVLSKFDINPIRKQKLMEESVFRDFAKHSSQKYLKQLNLQIDQDWSLEI